MSPTYRDVLASGVRLRVLEAGEGPAVILLHDLFLTSSTWDQVVTHLREDFRVIAPDFPGFGQSEKPPPSRFPYGFSSLTETIADLYAGLDLGRAALVGHGLGGAIALRLAAKHPELVSKLVLIDTLCYPSALSWRHRVALLPVVGGLVFKQLWNRSAFRNFYREVLVGPEASIPNTRIDQYYERFNTPVGRVSALATLRATVDTRSTVALTAQVHVPTLILWGDSDRLQPAAQGQRLAREVHGAGFEVIPAGHSPQEEQPITTARIITRFLRSERAR